MSDSTVETARTLAARAEALFLLIKGGVFERIDAAAAGIRASSFDRSSSNGVSDPTAVRALAGIDSAAQHRIEMTRAVEQAHRAVTRAIEIAREYPQARHGQDTVQDEKGCESCARVRIANGASRWEPPFVERSDLGGLLDSKMTLCRWCYVTARRLERLPTADECERHHRGEKIRTRADAR